MIEIVDREETNGGRGRFAKARKEVADALQDLPHDKTIKVPVEELASATDPARQSQAIRFGMNRLTTQKFSISIRDGFAYFSRRNGTA